MEGKHSSKPTRGYTCKIKNSFSLGHFNILLLFFNIFRMYILTNGSLVTITRGRTVIYPTDSFCIDGAVEHMPHAQNGDELGHHPQEPHEPVYYSGSELDQIAIICYPPITDTPKQVNIKSCSLTKNLISK